MWRRFKEKFIGDKDFYKLVLMVATPMMIQNGITNFVSLLDNIMVGQLGTEQMSGVAIVNQLMMVFNISIFGAVSGASIFSAQFYGKGDHEGVRNAFCFKLVNCLLFAALGIIIFLTAGSSLINLYLNEGSAESIALTYQYGMEYLMVTIIGIIPFTLSQVYASTLRETGETIVPMIAGVIAVFVNLVFNYLLIFGHFGFPQMGVAGAAVGSVDGAVVAVCGTFVGKTVSVTSFTVTLTLPIFFAFLFIVSFTVIVALPFFLAVTTPFLLTFATFFFDDTKEYFAFFDLFLIFIVCFSPTVIVSFETAGFAVFFACIKPEPRLRVKTTQRPRLIILLYITRSSLIIFFISISCFLF